MNHVEAREFAHKIMRTWKQQNSGLFDPDMWHQLSRAWRAKHGISATPYIFHDAMERGDVLEAQALIVATLTDEVSDEPR